ncbi:4-(cytidine 5'-diphospho)-2-C-methyl-D-erythritol kinase [Amycolatopsis sp. cg5]|uniref:4-(cytidine 5'-diphospho)-2-C-methyl-D-erythritol kinase n=1 Tax=Amycolatopsis sp. cg5 TaxID=3238802 RepID=UPI0035261E15
MFKSPSVRVSAPAKINLHLGVGNLRPDGRHDLVTVFQALSLTDEVVVSVSADPGVEIRGEGAGTVARGAANRAWQAVLALAEHCGRSTADIDVRLALHKKIPVAGGMAGGNADAAATLVGLAELWKLDLTRAELATVAARLGSDVPFHLFGGHALGTGRADELMGVDIPHQFHWVVALDHGGLSTPLVFEELELLRARAQPPRVGHYPPLLDALSSGDPGQLALLLGNDLQAAALSIRPRLGRTLEAGLSAGALGGLISGSGPTCVFLCQDHAHALRVGRRLSGYEGCRAVKVACGPVLGARVVDRQGEFA